MNHDQEARICELRSALESMCWQFATRGDNEHGRFLGSGGLSALESAFDTLGWSDPYYPTNDATGCAATNCKKWGTTGNITPAGYRFFCSKHYKEIME